MSQLETSFRHFTTSLNIVLEEEHRFHPTRRWRLDFADVDNKIGIELEGGIWIAGRHSRGAGYKADAEKYNEATKLGWRILRYCDKESFYKNFVRDYKTLLNGKDGRGA